MWEMWQVWNVMKHLTRKQFIQLGALGGASLDLVRKGDDRYDALRRGFNSRIDRYPREIAVCTSTEAVARAVGYAGGLGLPIAVKSGGHSMEAALSLATATLPLSSRKYSNK
jgi:FAD/FMN-containing dehydrogenase